MSPHAIWDDGRRGPGEMLAEMARESRNAEDDVTSGDVWPIESDERNYNDREILEMAHKANRGESNPIPRSRPLTDADFERLCEIGHRAR